MADSAKVALVRALISDTPAGEGVPMAFTDTELEAIVDLEGGSVKRAAAQCLSVLAASEVLMSKVIRTAQGLSTNGAAVAAELRALAKVWREDADSEETVDLVIIDPFTAPFTPEYL